MAHAGTVASICRHRVVTVGPSDDLTVAARLMREQHVGYLVVVEPVPAEHKLRPVGVLTDRDIVVAVVARDANPRELRVGEVMTASPALAVDHDGVSVALREMRRNGVRRLPVVDARGHLVGVLSLDDVLESLAVELQDVVGSMRNEQRIEGIVRN